MLALFPQFTPPLLATALVLFILYIRSCQTIPWMDPFNVTVTGSRYPISVPVAAKVQPVVSLVEAVSLQVTSPSTSSSHSISATSHRRKPLQTYKSPTIHDGFRIDSEFSHDSIFCLVLTQITRRERCTARPTVLLIIQPHVWLKLRQAGTPTSELPTIPILTLIPPPRPPRAVPTSTGSPCIRASDYRICRRQ